MDKKAILYTLTVITLAACGGGETPTSAYTESDSNTSPSSEAGSGGTSDTSEYNKDADTVIPVEAGSDASTPDVPDSSEPSVDAGTDAETPISDAGTDSSVPAPDAGVDSSVPDSECTPDSKDCSGNTPRTCNSTGTWVNGSSCPYICSEGVCTGSCTPTDKRCSGLASQTCSSSGQWATDTTCPFMCSGEGVCSGSCSPTTKQCSGDTPQTCSASGSWVSGSDCPYVCDSGNCIGVCEPGDHRCSGLNSQTCNSSGQWATDTTCPYVCTGAGNCTGECVPTTKDCQDDTPRTCDASGSWVSSSECTYVCQSGNCTGVCDPGSHRCSGLNSQTCSDLGQWVTDTTCPFVCSGEGVCSGVCVPTSKDCQGDVPRTCNSSGQWVNSSECQYVCISGTCSGVCDPGSTQCSDEQLQTCNTSGQWGTATNCAAVPGADSYCSAGSCTFDCSLDYDDCDGNPANGCEANLNTSASNCGYCGHSCCGGACGDGTCGLYDTGIMPGINNGVAVYDVDANNIYWASAPRTEINQQNRTGSITLLASNQPQVTGIDALGADIFWTTMGVDSPWYYDGGTFSKPIDGGSTTRYSQHGGQDWLTVTGTDIFHTRSDKATIEYISRADNSTSLLLGGSYTYRTPFVTDGTYLYATYNSYPTGQKPIVRVPIHGGTIEPFATAATPGYEYYGLSIDDTNLYYVRVTTGAGTTMSIYKQGLAGGAPTQLIPSNPQLGIVTATDGENAYYAVANPREIRKVSVDGDSSILLTTISGSGFITSMKTANQCVYWVNNTTTTIQAIAVSP